MSELEDKVKQSIKALKLYNPGAGLFGDSGALLAYSGGKDSGVLKALADMAGIPYKAVYSVTGVDPPELTTFIRRYHPDVQFRQSKDTMKDLIIHYGCPPLRNMRYCCRKLKESARSYIVVTGIRADESRSRAGRNVVEQCSVSKGSFIVNPILEWSFDDVWDFTRAHGLPYCSLYDEPEIKRIGCVMCPNAGSKGMKREAERWPGMAYAYRLACRQAYSKLVERDEFTITWQSGDDMYDWWIRGAKGQRRIRKHLKKQMEMDFGTDVENVSSLFD